jgi:hypothetical protein
MKGTKNKLLDFGGKVIFDQGNMPPTPSSSLASACFFFFLNLGYKITFSFHIKIYFIIVFLTFFYTIKILLFL